jgi:catechol 2,3-dioxygenase-like lactoylglutathione lyase family enzyme
MIDHLVYATPDVDSTVEFVARRLGVRAAPGGRHPGLGTRNALLGLGSGAYLEIIGVDAGAAGAGPDGPRPFGLDRIGEPRLATWAAQVHDIDDRVARARAAGYDPGPVRPMSRRLPDGTELHWRLTPPGADAVEVVPFLIEWAPGVLHPSTTSPPGCRLVGLAGEHPAPDAVRAGLAALGLELALSVADAAALLAVIEGPGGTLELR